METRHKIADWERAVAGRADIEFNAIYLKGGTVDFILGVVYQKTRHKVRGEYRRRARRVRWSSGGVCFNINNTAATDLAAFDISFDRS